MIRAFIDEYGVPTPVFFCDACHEPITTMFGGMVVYADAESDACSPHFVCHKDSLCQSATRAKAGHVRGIGTWDEMPDFLVKLAVSAGVFPEDVAKRYECLWQRGHVPDADDSECGTF